MDKVKTKIRKETLDKLSRQDRAEALDKARAIKKKLFSLPAFKKVKIVMFYASKDEEAKTDEMIDEALGAGKRVALPRCTSLKTIIPKEITDRKKDLEKGAFGICEPKECKKDISTEEIDVIVVPGVAFDKKGARLGRGKGYYDRFLKNLSPDKVTIGLAFDFQIVENLPKDSHDIPVSQVITN